MEQSLKKIVDEYNATRTGGLGSGISGVRDVGNESVLSESVPQNPIAKVG
jgi:hypothetical protein